MITLISGTNRPESNTLKMAHIVGGILDRHGEDVSLIDLHELPEELFVPASYATKPAAFEPFQKAILETDGIFTIVPEYNGAFPGVLKYFIDMLRFPESLYEKPAGFIGISAGQWGAIRAVEQLEMVFQYRHAHLFGRRCFLPNITRAFDGEGGLADKDLAARVEKTVTGFADFCRRVGCGTRT
jgi:NAD(P)H-dependent FMN reductase